MSNIVPKTIITPVELALVKNDLSKLTAEERLSLYNKTCESLGLNPLTSPFGYIEFKGGKLSFYALKNCTDQLRSIHNISIEITAKSKVDDLYVITAQAKMPSGRIDEDMGTVSIKGLSGEALGNAMLKAITKAKRRVTLSICGLGMLDETEAETIHDASIKDIETYAKPKQAEIIAPKSTSKVDELFDLAEETKVETEKPKTVVNHAPKPITYDQVTFKGGNFKGKKFAEIEPDILGAYMAQCSYNAVNQKQTDEQLRFFEMYEEHKQNRGNSRDNICRVCCDLHTLSS